jgi:hypothetical protein
MDSTFLMTVQTAIVMVPFTESIVPIHDVISAKWEIVVRYAFVDELAYVAICSDGTDKNCKNPLDRIGSVADCISIIS